MKNIIKSGILVLMAILAFTACDPQENDDYSLGTADGISSDQVSFKSEVSTQSDNVLKFVNTSDVHVPYAVLWNLGNGTTSKDKTVTGQYPMAGDYTVTLTLYAADGSSSSRSQIIHIEKNDYSLISTPAYINLTGGMDKPEGKVWVLDKYNNFAAEVAAATGYNVKGHMGLGPQNFFGQDWWGAGASEKEPWKIYEFKFTFAQNGTVLNINNTGVGYGRKASAASTGGFTVTEVVEDDATFNYGGGDYTFMIDESGKYPKLTLSGNAFMGYYCGSQEYDIFYQTDKVMALRVNNTIESQDWVFVYCLEELNIGVPPVVKEPKAIPLFDDFEDSEKTIVWGKEEMGSKTGISDNPVYIGNMSNKVYRYEKSTNPSSNLFFVAEDYKFDLTKQNKIKMKIFIPSYNDFTTENGAESWATSKKLLPKLVVKLYDSSLTDPWNSSAEKWIELTPDQLDKWIDVTLDFSSAASIQNYDKIVIQFGQEGHYGAGIFYFDDFTFSE